MIENRKITIEGAVPLIMHNGRTANPLDPYTKQLKAITGKRKKTDADYEAMAQVEWKAGLYLNDADKVIMPSVNIEACIIGGAKKSKLGKIFQGGMMVYDDAIFIHEGGSLKQLENDSRFWDTRAVKIGQNKIMRTRPIFNVWSMSFIVGYETEVLDKAQLIQAIEDAGRLVALGDYRPRYGRFNLTGDENAD